MASPAFDAMAALHTSNSCVEEKKAEGPEGPIDELSFARRAGSATCDHLSCVLRPEGEQWGERVLGLSGGGDRTSCTI